MGLALWSMTFKLCVLLNPATHPSIIQRGHQLDMIWLFINGQGIRLTQIYLFLLPKPMLTYARFGYSPICLGWNPSFKFRASAWPDSKWCKAHRSWTLGWHTIITDGRSQPLEYIGRRLAKDLCHAADGLATVTKYSNGSGDEKNFLLRSMGLICPWMMLAIQKSSPFKNIAIRIRKKIFFARWRSMCYMYCC